MDGTPGVIGLRANMKNKNTNHNESNTGGNQESVPAEVQPAELAAAQRWWGALEPADKVVAFEIAVIAQALQGDAVHPMLAGEVGLKRAYEAFRRELHKTFDERPEVLMHFYDPRPELNIGRLGLN
jgi:hypothetical protein